MRLLIDTLIAGMLLVVLAAVLLNQWQDRHQDERQRTVQHSLLRFREVIEYQSALGEIPLNSHRRPSTIKPTWFRDGLPVNTLVPGRLPWLDTAPDGDLNDNPPDPVINGPDQATFWYNPSRGIVRARVLPQFTERATLDHYNRLNGAFLTRFALPDERAARAPQPLLTPEAIALATALPEGQRRATLRSDGVGPAPTLISAPATSLISNPASGIAHAAPTGGSPSPSPGR